MKKKAKKEIKPTGRLLHERLGRNLAIFQIINFSGTTSTKCR